MARRPTTKIVIYKLRKQLLCVIENKAEIIKVNGKVDLDREFH